MGGLWHCFTHIIGDYTSYYLGDYNNPIGESLSTNQYTQRSIYIAMMITVTLW